VVIERRFIIGSESVRRNVAAFIAKLPFERPVEVFVRDYVEKRSLEQNALLWAWHSAAAKHTGHSSEEMHEFALMRHFGTQEIKVGELVRLVPLKRSSMRNKKEFNEFLESTVSWYISDFGLYLDERAA
jgi:hypothetical protein